MVYALLQPWICLTVGIGNVAQTWEYVDEPLHTFGSQPPCWWWSDTPSSVAQLYVSPYHPCIGPGEAVKEQGKEG